MNQTGRLVIIGLVLAVLAVGTFLGLQARPTWTWASADAVLEDVFGALPVASIDAGLVPRPQDGVRALSIVRGDFADPCASEVRAALGPAGGIALPREMEGRGRFQVLLVTPFEPFDLSSILAADYRDSPSTEDTDLDRILRYFDDLELEVVLGGSCEFGSAHAVEGRFREHPRFVRLAR